MARYKTPQHDWEADIRQILLNSHVPQCSLHIENVGKGGKHWTLSASDEVESPDNTQDEDAIIYGIGSHTKQLVVLLLSIIVDNLSSSEKEEHQYFRKLRLMYHEPWDEKFSVIFKHFSNGMEICLPKDPTLRQVALHYNSLPPMNHVLLAVDGASIMSKESFLRVASRLAETAYTNSTENYCEYSNGNYILLGYLIEAIGGASLAELMKRHLFTPLGMNKTYLGRPNSSTCHVAQPYTVSANGVRNLVDPWPYREDSVVTAAFGAHSCTRDMAIFLRKIQACLNGDESIFRRKSILHLFRLLVDDSTSLFGLFTTLDTSKVGCKSYNRLITPKNECSTYKLGYRGGNKEIEAYYLAGATKGYSCSSYFLPKRDFFIIVLTNATAFTDASDHISRFILQKSFDLSFAPTSKLSSLTRAIKNRINAGSQTSNSTKRVDVVNMSLLGAEAGKNLLERLASEDAENGIPKPYPVHLEGRYYNEVTEQSICVEGNQVQILGTAEGALSSPRPMGFIRIGDRTIQLRPLSDSEFTIDRFDPYSWQNLTLELGTEKQSGDKDKVIYLTRQSEIFLDKFVRIEASN